MLAGAAGNNLLPAHMGEFIRIYLLGTQFNVPKSTIFATLVVERLFDIVTVLVLRCVAFVFSDFNEHTYKAGGFLLCGVIVIMVASYLLTTRYQIWSNFIQRKLIFLSPNVRDKLASQLSHLTTGLQSMGSAQLYIHVLLFSVLKWLLMALCIYCSLVAFNINVSPTHTFIILGLSVAGLMLPTSPGFFGTIEYCFVLGLATVNIDPSVAVSAAIYYHVPMWLAVTITGLLSIKATGYSFKQLKSNKQPKPDK